MAEHNEITVITYTRNAEEHLKRLLPSVQWASRRIVVDMKSEDHTVEVARSLGCDVISTPIYPRVDGIRNRYLGEGSTEWIFVLDADEYLANDACDLVNELINHHGMQYDAFAIPRFNRIGGQIMRGSGWYPDHQIRLFRRECVRWPDATHQPPSMVTGADRLYQLVPPNCLHIHHNNYADLSEFIERQVRYALQDVYSPETLDLDGYADSMYKAFAQRHDPDNDGELSRALALLMAWDSIIRCLIHWDRIDAKPSLDRFLMMPVAIADRDFEAEAASLRQSLGRLERNFEAKEASLRQTLDRLERENRTLRNARVMQLALWAGRQWERIKVNMRRYRLL